MGRGGPDVVLRALPVGRGSLPWPWGGLLPGAVPHFLRMGGRQTGAKHPCRSGARKSLKKRGVARPALISGRVQGPRAPSPDESPQAPRGAPENPPRNPCSERKSAVPGGREPRPGGLRPRRQTAARCNPNSHSGPQSRIAAYYYIKKTRGCLDCGTAEQHIRDGAGALPADAILPQNMFDGACARTALSTKTKQAKACNLSNGGVSENPFVWAGCRRFERSGRLCNNVLRFKFFTRRSSQALPAACRKHAEGQARGQPRPQQRSNSKGPRPPTRPPRPRRQGLRSGSQRCFEFLRSRRSRGGGTSGHSPRTRGP